MPKLTIRNSRVNIIVEPFGQNLQSLTLTGCEFPNRKAFDLMSFLPREKRLEEDGTPHQVLQILKLDDTVMLSQLVIKIANIIKEIAIMG